MKNFLLIAIAVSMCDSCERQSFEKSKFKSDGIIDERDATSEFDSSDLNSMYGLPAFELPET